MKIKSYDFWMILACLLWLLFLALSPIVSRDALIHHMALPKLWLEQGIFSVDAYRTYAFYPSNLQAIYQAALFYKIEWLPKIVHALFLVATGYLVYQYLRRSGINNHLASLGFALTLTIPICQRLASQAYVDLGLLFFSTLALIYFLYWKQSNFAVMKFFYVAAIAAGLALGTKYNGMLIVAILCFLCLLTYGQYSKTYIKPLLYSGAFAAIAVALASPWLIRNYLASGGNPFYPLLTSLFPDSIDNVQPLYPVLDHRLLYRMVEGESWVEIALLPLRIFFQGQDDNFLRFDGQLNPLMLALTPFAFIGRRRAKSSSATNSTDDAKPAATLISDRLILLLFAVLIILVSLGSHAIRIRYLIAMISPIVILNIYAIDYFFRQKNLVTTCTAYLSISIYILYNAFYGYYLTKDLDHIQYILSNESKMAYISRKIQLYPIYQYINQHVSHNAVIYDVMSGHRSYYIDREYIHHPNHVDVVFMNYLIQNKDDAAYETYLRSLKTRHGAGVTHLLIRPGLLVHTYQRMFPAHPPSAIQHFVRFLRRQKVLAQADDAVLYELVARQAESSATPGRTAAGGS